MTEHAEISRRSGVFGFFTLVSRILGLVRDAVIAYFFGTKMAADAFYVAFRIPNLLRRLLAEGSLTIAFVPVFTEYIKKGHDEGRRVASIVFTYLSLLLVFIVVLGIIFAPWIVKAVAYGFEAEPDKFSLTVYLTRLMFPYILLVSLMAFAMGVLNTMKHFGAPAASPIVLNLGIIFGAAVISRFTEMPVVGLALGVLLGGILQLLLQLPWMAREGMLPRFNFEWRHPALKRLGLLMLPSIYGAAIYQVNVLIITLLASFLPEGSVSYLWYADRINEFPLGIFAVAVATATLPTLSDYAVDKNHGAFKDTLNFSLRAAWLMDIPAMIGILLLAEPIVKVIFQRGEFTELSTHGTVIALRFFALGIPFVTGVRVLVPAFYAIHRPKMPVIAATVALFVNALAGFILMRPFLHGGLALALSLSAAVNFFLMIYFYRRTMGALGLRRILKSIGTISLGCLAIVAVNLVAMHLLKFFKDTGGLISALELFTMIAISVVLYIGIIRIVAHEEFQYFSNLIKMWRR